MGNKKKILILFEGQHLAFSPTIKQLYDHLAKENSVTVLAQSSEKFIKEKLGKKFVIIMENGKKKEIEIQTGYSADGTVEVVSGLKENDVIYN